jgi:nucleoside 2-deoxyribosyltransferase
VRNGDLSRVVYVAGPYRGKDNFEIAENVRNAERVGLAIWKIGMVALVPHLNSVHFQGCLPDDVWLRGDIELLKRCDAILMVDGWAKSVGATHEMDVAVECGIPVFYSVKDLKEWGKHE